MSALPPLPDHRPAVLRALASLGADSAPTGVTIATIGDRAGLDAGRAWLAVHQLAQGGFIVAPASNRRRRIEERRLWSLTPEGVALIPHLKGEGL